MGHHTAQQLQSVAVDDKAIVAVRYPELVLHDQDPIQIGHFVPHDHTTEYRGFRTVLWEVPRDSRDLLAAIVGYRSISQLPPKVLSGPQSRSDSAAPGNV